MRVFRASESETNLCCFLHSKLVLECERLTSAAFYIACSVQRKNFFSFTWPLESFKMAANFCSRWLQQNKNENDCLPRSKKTQVGGDDSDSENDSGETLRHWQDPNEITFENNLFQLIVRTSPVKRAQKFKLEDRQFTLKVVPKTSQSDPPLIQILQFLEDGMNFILGQIKAFFNPSEHRIAYLTLYQEPMVPLEINLIISIDIVLGALTLVN